MAKPTFVQLAQVFKPGKHSIQGMFASVKLDGLRALWIPESRGVPATAVPWANDPKTGVLATGLWSRRSKVIHAPDWFLDSLPPIPVEGELYIGPGKFQRTQSIVRTENPATVDWSGVQFMMFDAPPPSVVLGDRVIDDKPYFVKRLTGCYQWWSDRCDSPVEVAARCPFETRLKYLVASDIAIPHHQQRLSSPLDAATREFNKLYNDALDSGAEGVMLKVPHSLYECCRSWDVLKVKPSFDCEATVVGFTTGRETDRGSKHLGRIGALILKSDSGQIYKCSGCTDAEREFATHDMRLWAMANPETEVPDWVDGVLVKRGDRITVTYRELTDVGIPREARLWRKREVD